LARSSRYDLLTRDTVTSARTPNKQWPGTSGDVGDPLVDQLVAAANSAPRDAQLAQSLWKMSGGELVDRVGPCILMTHSAGGPFGWLVANEKPNLVKAVVSSKATAPLVGPGGAAGTPLPNLGHADRICRPSVAGRRAGVLDALCKSGARAEGDRSQRSILWRTRDVREQPSSGVDVIKGADRAARAENRHRPQSLV
jgi:pimeloyl-ACP methyl ester carboxylesterase